MLSLEDIRENWAVLGGFAAGLIAWGETRLKADSAKKTADKAASDIANIHTSIATLNTHAEYTRAGIDEIKEAIRDIRMTQQS